MPVMATVVRWPPLEGVTRILPGYWTGMVHRLTGRCQSVLTRWRALTRATGQSALWDDYMIVSLRYYHMILP